MTKKHLNAIIKHICPLVIVQTLSRLVFVSAAVNAAVSLLLRVWGVVRACCVENDRKAVGMPSQILKVGV